MSKSVAIYHLVKANDTFEDATQAIVALVHAAELENPGMDRHFYLDIEGHKNSVGGWDRDMFELQKEFMLGFLVQHLKEVLMPLCKVRNPKAQDNEVPKAFEIIPRESKALIKELASMGPLGDVQSFEIIDGDNLRSPASD